MAGLLPFMNIMYPTQPLMQDFPNLPLVNPTSWRMLQFGPYWFPGTCQMRNQESKLSLIKKKIPFTAGDYVPGNSSLTGTTLEFFGTIGPGIRGAGGSLLRTQADVENERQLLAGLQSIGRQSLYVGPNKFIWAYLEDFTMTPTDGSGFRLADWTAKFYCDDPRWYGSNSGASNQTHTGEPGTQGLPNMNVMTYTVNSGPGLSVAQTVMQNGNTKAFPVFVWTAVNGPVNQPAMYIANSASWDLGGYPYQGLGLTFSQLNMATGDQLVVFCDPRPEYQQIACTYYQGGGWPGVSAVPTNAWAFVKPANDLVNTVDFQYFLPWISASNVDDGSGGLNYIFFNCLGTGGQAQVEVLYWDTYN